MKNKKQVESKTGDVHVMPVVGHVDSHACGCEPRVVHAGKPVQLFIHNSKVKH